jgi:hypothetical protein
MTRSTVDPLQAFQWEPQPAAQRLLDRLIADYEQACPRAAAFAQRLAAETGTRFFDWLDHLAAPGSAELVGELRETGFEEDGTAAIGNVYAHAGAIFPRVVLTDGLRGAALKVESVADFLAAHGLQAEVAGEPLGQMRQATAWVAERGAELRVIERHGWRSFRTPEFDAAQAIAAQRHLEAFRTRQRRFPLDDDAAAFGHTHALIDRAVAELGVDWAADLWFAAERDYWLRRNRAARVQKARQDRLGLGWANHDHHTYRCRRETFDQLVATLEKLGCHCRERFYAGADAGWGAQVLEQPATGVVIFADVDMAPEEVRGDFAHEGLSGRQDLGTVGLWCELHGESVLEAGLHHLEAQFDFDGLREQLLAEAGIGMMDPFSNWDHLKQQFTQGERWEVAPERIERLTKAGRISDAQAEQFLKHGAIGSHLENLERNDGYKGFNQTGISEIIAGTDPRLHGATA